MAGGTPRPGVPVRGSTSGRPVMAAFDLLGRRWTLRILWELGQSPGGFRELQRRCEHMSSSVLSTRLGELIDTRLLVLREDRYHLSRLGEDLIDALQPLFAWSRQWAEEADGSAAQGPARHDE
ncbi:winged helix-turn-helix transcriptional regulator [Streptomyces sp. NPDC048111]|uniref:winged helix-turn-helix transcriptional regulator n=1 Tax=Streptomyces sp. NPDC048111 TaxID=3365500 RepID=UPI00371A83D6